MTIAEVLRKKFAVCLLACDHLLPHIDQKKGHSASMLGSPEVQRIADFPCPDHIQ